MDYCATFGEGAGGETTTALTINENLHQYELINDKYINRWMNVTF